MHLSFLTAWANTRLRNNKCIAITSPVHTIAHNQIMPIINALFCVTCSGSDAIAIQVYFVVFLCCLWCLSAWTMIAHFASHIAKLLGCSLRHKFFQLLYLWQYSLKATNYNLANPLNHILPLPVSSTREQYENNIYFIDVRVHYPGSFFCTPVFLCSFLEDLPVNEFFHLNWESFINCFSLKDYVLK